MLSQFLPNSGYALLNQKTGLSAIPSGAGPAGDPIWIKTGTEPKGLIAAEAIPIKLHDIAGEWVIYAARPAAEFWNSPAVKSIDFIEVCSYAALGLFTLFSLGVFRMLRKNQMDIQSRNAELEASVVSRTKDLDHSNQHLETQLQHVKQIGVQVSSSIESLAETSASLKSVVAESRTGVSEVSTAVDECSAAAEVSLATSQDLVYAMEHLANMSVNGLTAVQAMVDEIQTIKAGAIDQSASVSGATKAFETLQGSISELATSMTTVRNQTDISSRTLLDLAALGKEIGSIVSIIDAIAMQTNLLALNAAIEAARAGDAGRGFAVVADEVRKLAEGTSDSTSKVSALVKSVQKSVKEAEGSMRSTEKTVVETEARTRAAATEITGAVGALERIRSAAQENVDAVERISKQIGDVRQLSEVTASVSEETTASLLELNNLAKTVAQSSRTAANAGDNQRRSADLLTETESKLHLIITDLKVASVGSQTGTAA